MEVERKEKKKREIVRGNEEDRVGGQERGRKKGREKEGETERYGQPHKEETSSGSDPEARTRDSVTYRITDPTENRAWVSD